MSRFSDFATLCWKHSVDTQSNMVFNLAMNKLLKKQIQADRKLIEDLGGATAVAEKLGFDVRRGGSQRVHNWMKRGIPLEARVQHHEILGLPPQLKQIA